ncbi:hypothetical protein N9492_00150 [Flavobacteriaceae bacterium]|nr:hypothetical protein [Flavobacteriaceae bacterium]
MSYFILAVVVCMVTGFLGRYVAKEKNRSSFEGFILGFLFNLLGVIIVALLPTKEKRIDVDEPEASFSYSELFGYIFFFILGLTILILMASSRS